MAGQHTILLVQASTKDTRQFSDYESLTDALEGNLFLPFHKHL